MAGMLPVLGNTTASLVFLVTRGCENPLQERRACLKAAAGRVCSVVQQRTRLRFRRQAPCSSGLDHELAQKMA